MPDVILSVTDHFQKPNGSPLGSTPEGLLWETGSSVIAIQNQRAIFNTPYTEHPHAVINVGTSDHYVDTQVYGVGDAVIARYLNISNYIRLRWAQSIEPTSNQYALYTCYYNVGFWPNDPDQHQHVFYSGTIPCATSVIHDHPAPNIGSGYQHTHEHTLAQQSVQYQTEYGERTATWFIVEERINGTFVERYREEHPMGTGTILGLESIGDTVYVFINHILEVTFNSPQNPLATRVGIGRGGPTVNAHPGGHEALVANAYEVGGQKQMMLI